MITSAEERADRDAGAPLGGCPPGDTADMARHARRARVRRAKARARNWLGATAPGRRLTRRRGRMRRVSVVGNSGSGKTTVAAALAERLGVACTELDAINHQPNWTPLPVDEFRR